MSNYPTIRNPLLPSPPSMRRKSFSADSLRSSISTASIKSFMNQLSTTAVAASTRMHHRRKIMPLMPKSVTEKSMVNHRYTLEPLVHYNGPFHTLESLPTETLYWIKDEQTSTLVKNPLTDYQRSIVLRKPISPMFYLRILQIISTHSSKTRIYRCGVQVNQETCISSYATSEKTGKHSSIAQFDETFLFDIEQQTTATLTVYAQTKNSHIFQKAKKEICLGTETIPLDLSPKAKTTERIVLCDDLQNTTFQLLVVYGTYMSHRTQNMMNNTILFEDFVTVYIQTGMVPVSNRLYSIVHINSYCFKRMDRFWGVLRGVQFELYDFEYKEVTRKTHTND
ncbi:hypothetical protein BD560DRAFT_379154 [Blakeslea trispora]|nr:hypothetical protein BD560DRAFT_379154 [Blakeslea trispora]